MVYGRPAVADVWSVALVALTKEFEIVPAAATEWTGSEDGKTWTFKLRGDMVWSDGNPVTAADYVKTFQYSAEPPHGWDFTFFWDGNIVNYSEALAGTVKPEDIGVAMGANEFELIFTTVEPAPYMPAKLLYSGPLSRAALESTGPLYNTNPATAVSSGPFIIDEWVRDQSLTYKRNQTYTGPFAVPIQRVLIKFASPAQFFTMYEAGEIDYMEGPAPAELQIMEADPDKANEIYQGVGDFGCFYFFFDTTNAPFDNIKVRQAFSHVLDRDAMKQQIWGRQANPAPSFLAPGFPASNTEALASIQAFDPEAGKALLTEAGFPNGEGFPGLTLQVRGGPNPVEDATTKAYAAMLKEHLNINIEVQTVDRSTFYEQMPKNEIQFGWVSYGMDFLDPFNMLDTVWTTKGRHSYSNPEVDKLIAQAGAFIGDPAERLAMFQEAERIIVTDVPAVFTYFSTPIQFIKPYVKGDALVPDKNGIRAIHWPGFANNSSVITSLYIGNDAPTDRA